MIEKEDDSQVTATIEETTKLIEELRLIQEEEEDHVLRLQKSHQLSETLTIDQPEEYHISNLDRTLSATEIVERLQEIMLAADPSFPSNGILRFELLKEPLVGGSRGTGFISFHNHAVAKQFLKVAENPGIKLSCKQICVSFKKQDTRPNLSKLAEPFQISKIDLSLQNRRQLSVDNSIFEALHTIESEGSLKLVANITGATLTVTFSTTENDKRIDMIALFNAAKVINCMCDYDENPHPSGAHSKLKVFKAIYFEFSSPPALLRAAENTIISSRAAFSCSSYEAARFYYQGTKELMKSSSVGTTDLLWENATDGDSYSGWTVTLDPTASTYGAFSRATVWKLTLKNPSLDTNARFVKELKKFGFIGVQKLLIKRSVSCHNIWARQLFPSGLNWKSVKNILPFSLCYLLHCLIANNKIDFSSSEMQRKMIISIDHIRAANVQAAEDALIELCVNRNFDRSKDFCTEFDAVVRRFNNFDALGKNNEYHSSQRFDQFVNKRRKTETPGIGSDQHIVRRVLVTPMRVFPCVPMTEAGNRMLREYENYSRRFLRVVFTNEEFQKCSGSVLSEQYIERIRRLMKDGIPVGGSLFKFLGYSNGQLKDHSCWFFCEDNFFDLKWSCASDTPTVKALRESIGDLDIVRTQHIGKYGARLGQAFSTTTTSLEIPLDYVFGIDDVNRDGYCFSDGVGCISEKCATAFATLARLPYTPSAFQIRFGGCKGMVSLLKSSSFPISYARGTIDSSDEKSKIIEIGNDKLNTLDTHSIIANEGEPDWMLAIRPSMEKFHSSHNHLEYCTHAKCNKLYLNREIISILSSRGVSDEVFMRKVGNTLARIDNITSDASLAVIALREGGTWATQAAALALEAGENIQYHKLFQDMANIVIRQRLGQMMQKAHILIHQGCRLMGVMDETGLLQPGEVFIQHQQMPFLSMEGSEEDVVQRALYSTSRDDEDWLCSTVKSMHSLVIRKEAQIAIGRNPCLHPGDIRVVKAVDIPSLHHLFDVVVFPATGDRPLPNEMSGGDLDGDDYFCIWDPELIPKEDYAPMEVVHNCTNTNDASIQSRDEYDLEEWFLKYIQNENLGRICIAHLCWADKEPDGVKSAPCLELARLQTIAVDFNKTGVPAILPKRLTLHRRPDFLESEWKVSYESPKLLGKIYRAVKEKLNAMCNIARTVCKEYSEEVNISNCLHKESDQNLSWAIVKLDKERLKEYDEWYKILLKYNNALLSMMRKHGIVKEAELLVGHVRQLSSMKKRKFEYVGSSPNEALLHELQNLRIKFRTIFWSNVFLSYKDFLTLRADDQRESHFSLPDDSDLKTRAATAARYEWNDLKGSITKEVKARVEASAKAWVLCTKELSSRQQKPSWVCESFPLLLADIISSIASEC